MPQRRRRTYFERIDGAPEPLVVRVEHRVGFSEADVMGIAWHGRYPAFAEKAWAELGRRCGLGFREFHAANLQAPIVQFHLDYHRSLHLDEEFVIQASLVWCEGARMNTEYAFFGETGALAATGYTVQMITHGETARPCLVTPPLLERVRERWKAGELSWDP